MKILIAGASGFIGKELTSFLKAYGHKIVHLVRNPRPEGSNAFFWNPEKEELPLSVFSDVDAVINLCGENLFHLPWNSKQKEKIKNSRIQATKTLVKGLLQLKKGPDLFINTSAVGFYGNCGDIWCAEDASKGKGFLADVCAEWEAAVIPLEEKGIRTLIFRFGIVLGVHGGVLKKLLPLFRIRLGGRLGSGKQYMSWIAIDDLLAIFLFALTSKTLGSGAVNVVAPCPVTNREFTKTLGKALRCPTWLSMPAFLLCLIFGWEKANELLLYSIRAEPSKLKKAGYLFKYPTLEKTLSHLELSPKLRKI